jgi:imidazolonepropionase-like amidohydrolase
LYDAGARFLAGSDLPALGLQAGRGLHQEMAAMVAAGVTPLDALRAATLHPALALGTADSMGTVEAGKVADLVILDADPLADIRNTERISGVVLRGHYLGQKRLGALKKDAVRARRWRSVLATLGW